MSRLGTAITGYLIIGAVMWGGGVIDWQDSGLNTVLLDKSTTGVSPNESVSGEIEDLRGPPSGVTGFGVGALVVIWDLLIKFVGAVFWPITVLISIDAPVRVTVMAGGPTSMAFVVGFLRFIRSSA